jgi:hypothetical protein
MKGMGKRTRAVVKLDRRTRRMHTFSGNDLLQETRKEDL